jgi:hypothetical protein
VHYSTDSRILFNGAKVVGTREIIFSDFAVRCFLNVPHKPLVGSFEGAPFGAIPVCMYVCM